MATRARGWWFDGALGLVVVGLSVLLLSGCAHQAPAPEREPIAIPAPVTGPDTAVGPGGSADPAAGPLPSLTMPREWQHHNGEDYDDLFDRMRAGVWPCVNQGGC